MRNQLLKLTKKNSTKSERRVGEILKRNRIKFKAKHKIGEYEVDFLIGRLAIEVDGSAHQKTDTAKDTYLASKGYVPIHVSAEADIKAIEQELLTLVQNNNG